ncbi:MAG: hypothetical protein R2706_20660, partial [Acidimicrobiales bacterium]
MEINRRQFVIGAGLTPLLRYFPASMTGVASSQESGEDFRFFDEHQAAVVREATARLIPGPSDDPA